MTHGFHGNNTTQLAAAVFSLNDVTNCPAHVSASIVKLIFSKQMSLPIIQIYCAAISEHVFVRAYVCTFVYEIPQLL